MGHRVNNELGVGGVIPLTTCDEDIKISSLPFAGDQMAGMIIFFGNK
jgi:hypothetical protein